MTDYACCRRHASSRVKATGTAFVHLPRVRSTDRGRQIDGSVEIIITAVQGRELDTMLRVAHRRLLHASDLTQEAFSPRVAGCVRGNRSGRIGNCSRNGDFARTTAGPQNNPAK